MDSEKQLKIQISTRGMQLAVVSDVVIVPELPKQYQSLTVEIEKAY